MKIFKIINGQPVMTSNKLLHMSCCDCGLVHFLRIISVNKEFAVVAYRDDFLTRLARRSKRSSKKKKL